MNLRATRPPPTVRDRREARSEIPVDAIALLLASTAERSSLRGIALSSVEGVALAGAGDIDADELARMGTERSLSGSLARVPASLRAGEALFTASIDVEGVPLVLSAIGKSEPDAQHVFAAVERIFGLAEGRAHYGGPTFRGPLSGSAKGALSGPRFSCQITKITDAVKTSASTQRLGTDIAAVFVAAPGRGGIDFAMAGRSARRPGGSRVTRVGSTTRLTFFGRSGRPGRGGFDALSVRFSAARVRFRDDASA